MPYTAKTFKEWQEAFYMFDNEWEMEVAKAAWDYQQGRIDELASGCDVNKLKDRITRLEQIIEGLLRGSVA